MNQGILGFDIGEEYSQAALLLPGEKEPVCIHYSEKEEDYLLHNLVCYQEHRLWYSLKAKEILEQGEGDRICDILKQVRAHESIVLEGVSYLYQDIFISLLLEEIRQVI